MDWQIGLMLALYRWIGDGLADWYRFGVASADFERLSDRLVLGRHFENRCCSRIGKLVKDWHWIGMELALNGRVVRVYR